MNDKKIVSVRPSPLASVAGSIGGIVGIGMGIVFLSSVPPDPGPDGLRSVFFLVWFLVCAGIVLYSVRNLLSFSPEERNALPLTASDVVELDGGEEKSSCSDFAARLRKLESLRRDNLVSEEEFQRKRKEILDEKW